MICLGSGGGDRGQAYGGGDRSQVYGGGRGAPTGGHRGGRKRSGFVWSSASPWAHTGADQHGVVFPRPALIWPPPAFPAPSLAHPPPAPTPPTPVPSSATIGEELDQRLFVLAAAEKAPVVASVSRKRLARHARLGAGTVAMIRPNQRRRAGGRRAPTGFLWLPPGPSAPPWPHEGMYRHGTVFAGNAGANHRPRARGRGGGRVPTDFLWPPSGPSAPPWPHEGACQHGVVFAGPALTPSARAYAYAPAPGAFPALSSTPLPAVASSQASLPAAEETPKVDTALVSKKGPAHPARPGARTVGANHLFVNVADMLLCDVSINPDSKSRPVNMELPGGLIKLHGETHLEGNLPAYDGTKSLYTADPLLFEFAVTLVDPEKKDKQRTVKEYKIAIHIAGRTDLFHLQQLPQETIHVLDFVLRQSPSWKSFFCTTFGHRGDSGEGLECWRGPTLMRLSLSIGISATCFVKTVAAQEFQLITNNFCYIYGRSTRPASDVKCSPAIPNSSQPVREVAISSSPSSNKMIGTSKIQVMFRIGNFGSFAMLFEDTCTVEEIVSAAFQKQNINIYDAVVRFNSRNAYFEDTLFYLNTNNDKECTIYIGPRFRGGQPPSSSFTVPTTVSFEEYMATLGDELFDVVTFPLDPALYFIGMAQYFISLGLKAIDIAKMFFELLETYHEKQECLLNFTLADLKYDTTSNKLMFSDPVGTAAFHPNCYCQNMSDAGRVLSSIFKFDEVRVLAGHAGIYLPAGTAIDNTKVPKLPPLVELLIHDLQTCVRLPNVSTSKRKRAYFCNHVGVMTPAERLSFWLTAELHFEYMGGEHTLNTHLRKQYVANWTTAAKRSTALRAVYSWRSYVKTSLGSQWSFGRNWLAHAPSKLTLKFTEKQSEAYLNITFKWLLYYVILKHTFPGAAIHWNKTPLPPAQPMPMLQNLVPAASGPAPRPLMLSNHFTVDQLLNTRGSL